MGIWIEHWVDLGDRDHGILKRVIYQLFEV